MQAEINRSGYAAGTFGPRARAARSVAVQLPLREMRFRKFGVVDMIKLNRIGNKLGLAGAVGVLLAIGMVANQMVTESKIEESSGRAAQSQKVADNSLSAHIDLRKIQLAASAVRLARNAGRGRKGVADLQRYKTSVAKELDAALETARRPDARERLQKIKALMDGFTAAVEDLAKAQSTLLAQIDKRSVVSDEWTKAVAAQLGSPAMAKLDNRSEIERLLFQADARVNSLRAAAWKLGSTGDANLVTEMAKTEASLKDVFNKLRGEADDRELLVVVSNLSSIVKRFLAANEESVKTEQAKNDIIANRTVKAAADVADLMEPPSPARNRMRRTSKDEVMADTERANQINLIMAIVVVLSLIASVVFSFLGVARPMTRLNGALGKMAGGDLDVEIPAPAVATKSATSPRPVTVIRENAEHKAREEAEAKVEQDQVAAQRRKQEMIKLADDFEGAVGNIVETVSSASSQLEAAAGTLTTTAERAQELTTMVAAASEEASTNVQSVASSTEEMASSITEIGRQVQESARMANEAVDQARTTNDRVSELSKAAARIGAVVELINTIAEQTNCWRSTPPSRRPAPATPVAVLPSWRPR
jgi:methyl-accepting chemotaxis protein